MIDYLINLFRALFELVKKMFLLDKPPSKEVQWLEKKAAEQKKKLEEIDEEDPSDSDIVDHFNK